LVRFYLTLNLKNFVLFSQILSNCIALIRNRSGEFRQFGLLEGFKSHDLAVVVNAVERNSCVGRNRHLMFSFEDFGADVVENVIPG